MKPLVKTIAFCIFFAFEIIYTPLIIILAVASRLSRRPIDVGLGPMPLINNVYHKKSLIAQGYTAETFVESLYFITSDFDRIFVYKSKLMKVVARELKLTFVFAIMRYRCLYVYFNGGPLGNSNFLWLIEPIIYRLAGVRTVVMPYGGDVQDVIRTPNLLFRHVMSKDYPLQRYVRKTISRKIDVWSNHADHVIAGCDWVDYMHFWHTLMVAHFSIDTSDWRVTSRQDHAHSPNRPFRVLHAPNHTAIKGTDSFVKAIAELQAEGELIELVFVQGLSNTELKKLIESVDVVADQLIIGWYAMFAIEAMAMGKPVLCYLRDDLQQLYVDAGLIEDDEIPIINCSQRNVKETLRLLMRDPGRVADAEKRGPVYVSRHHSLAAVGSVFSGINKSIGLFPGELVKDGK